MKFTQILSLVFLIILLAVLFHAPHEEFFVCPKTLSDKCSGRFTSKSCQQKKYCDWTRVTPHDYVSIPSNMIVSTSTSTSTSSTSVTDSQSQQDYTSLEITGFINKPLCDL